MFLYYIVKKTSNGLEVNFVKFNFIFLIENKLRGSGMREDLIKFYNHEIENYY